MSVRLCIGITDIEPGWEILIEQLGIWRERLNWAALDPQLYSAVIVNRSLAKTEMQALRAYLRAGGAVLDDGHFLSAAGVNLRRTHVNAIAAPSDPPFDNLWLLDVDAGLRRHPSARRLDGTVFIGDVDGGALVHLPFHISSVMKRHDFVRRRFFSPTGSHPDEIVASRPRGEYRKVVDDALRWLHAQRGIPYAHLWHFPESDSTIFGLRVDTDNGSPRELEMLREISEREDTPLSWFLHVAAHDSHLDLFERYSRHEIASHGYRHRAFSDYEGNWGNVAESLGVLRHAGHTPIGYAQPTGRWSRGLDRALQDLRIVYSSEFSLDYDGLPFHPWAGSGRSSVLQVPVHPISAGAIRRIGGAEDDIHSYLQFVLARKRAQGEPVFLYHHPSDGAFEAVASVIRTAGQGRIRGTTLGDYALWWIERGLSGFSANMDGNTVDIAPRLRRSDIRVHLVRPDGAEYFAAAAERLASDATEWRQPERIPFTPPDNLASIRRPALRLLRHSIEDLYSRVRQ